MVAASLEELRIRCVSLRETVVVTLPFEQPKGGAEFFVGNLVPLLALVKLA
jgi:hypothetical protein